MKLKSSAGVKKPAAKKSVSDVSNQIAGIDAEISVKRQQVSDIEQEIEALYQKRLELAIHPYKLGDTVLAEVQVGKTKKKTKCVLEMGEGGILYLRPFKNDGELSGRRFSLIPVGEKTYEDYLEKA